MVLPSDDPWASYARTVVSITGPSGGDDMDLPAGDLVVRPATPGVFDRWPWPTEDPVPILTAWDPGPERLDLVENRRRQSALEAALHPAAHTLLRAVGEDPESGHVEEGVAALGLSVTRALVLGAHYGQEAIFVWTPREWALVACSGSRRVTLGWSLRGVRVPSPC